MTVRDRDGGDEPTWPEVSDRSHAIEVAARALVVYLDDDGMCRVCGETLDQCPEDCEARRLRAVLDDATEGLGAEDE